MKRFKIAREAQPGVRGMALWCSLLGLALFVLPELASATRCLVPQLPRPTEPYAVTRDRLTIEGQWLSGQSAALAPPSDPQVGDTWMWYIWDLGGYPQASLKPCTVRGMGDHCYVVVDDDEWNVSIDQVAVDRIVLHFDSQSVGDFPDQGIWDLSVSHFGNPPDPLDRLERIFLLYYRFDISADGYFWIYDQYPDGTQPFSSNEADVVYLATDGGNAGGDYMLAVAAHEFHHMIHFNQDANEDLWVEEGLGELAMWLFGNPDHISSFNSNPDNSLTNWGGGWADYIQTYLWTLYSYEQYGGQPMIYNLVHDPTNGMAGYQNALDGQGYTTSMEDVFGDWAVANFLDDPSVPDGQFGYVGDDLPAFSAFRTHSTYPATGSGIVQVWATDYIRLSNLSGAPNLDFNGADSRDFRVAMMALDPVLPALVHFVELDYFNDGAYEFLDALGYEQVVISVANVSGLSSGTYSYSVGNISTAVPDQPGESIVLRSSPNPFNPLAELDFTLPHRAHAHLVIHDARGGLVDTLIDRELSAGKHHLRWNADDLPSGIYLARLQVDQQKVSQLKLSLIK